MRSIFLSYGHAEADDARVLKEDLEHRGYTVWFDESGLHAGDDWEATIEAKLRECDQFVLLMTPHSVRRRNPRATASEDGYCLNELTKALQFQKPIVPVLLARLDDGPPTSICRLQWLDLSDCRPFSPRTEKYQAKLDRLVTAIEGGDVSGPSDSEELRLRDKLDPPDYSIELSTHLGHFTGREWLIGRIDRWLASEPASPVLWIIGQPGIGKTALAAKLCHERADAFHLCVHGHEDKADPRRVLLSLAYQLSTHLPEYRRRLARLDLDKEVAKNADTIFDNLLLRLLTTGGYPSPGRALLVVIDALDEASAHGRNDLADVIGRRWKQLPPWVRLLVTTRPTSEVTARLQGLAPIVLDVESLENHADVRMYLTRRFGEIGVATPPDLLELIEQKCAGLFLYATLLVDAVRAGHLAVASIPDLPAGLSLWYRRECERLFPDAKQFAEELRPLINVIIAQRGPLPVPLVRDVLKLSDFELDQRLQRLGTLFSVRLGDAARGVVVAPAHRSLSSWLVERDPLTGTALAGVFAADPTGGEQLLQEHGWSLYRAGRLQTVEYYRHHLVHHIAATGQWERLETLLTDVELLQQARRDGRQFEWARLWLTFTGRLDPVRLYRDLLDQTPTSPAELLAHASRLGTVGAFVRDLGLTRDALPFLDRCVALRARAADLDSGPLAGELRDLAELYRLDRQYDRAEALYRRALAIYQRLDPDGPEVATIFHDFAKFYRDQGRYGEALASNHRALSLCESQRPPDARRLGLSINDMGVMLWEKGNAARASDYYERARQLFLDAFGPQDPDFATCLHNIGQVNKGASDGLDLRYLRRALRILEQNYVPHQRDVQTCRQTLAGHLEARGELAEAHDLYQRIIEVAAVIADSNASAEWARARQRKIERRKDAAREFISQVQQYIVPAQPGATGLPILVSDALTRVTRRTGTSPPPAIALTAPLAVQPGSDSRLFCRHLLEAGLFFLHYGYLDSALDLLDATIAALTALAPGNARLRAGALRALAICHENRSAFREAAAHAEALLDLVKGEGPAERVVAVSRRAARLNYLYGAYDHALGLLEQAARKAALAVRHDIAADLNEYALSLKNDRAEYVVSERYYRLALELDPRVAVYHGNLAVLLSTALGRHDEGEQLYRRALELDPHDGTNLGNYAFFVQHVRRDAAEAEVLYKRALHVLPRDPNNNNNYATLRLMSGDVAGASTLVARAWRVKEDLVRNPVTTQGTAHDRISSRILFVKVALEDLAKRPVDLYLGQLRFLFETGIAHAPWAADAFFVWLRTEVGGDRGNFMDCIARAISDRLALAELNQMADWRRISLVPLDEQWPAPAA